MGIYDEKVGFSESVVVNKVQIQVKEPGKPGSKGLTLHNTNIDEVFSRIKFLFESLEKTEGSIKIVHYKGVEARNEKKTE